MPAPARSGLRVCRWGFLTLSVFALLSACDQLPPELGGRSHRANYPAVDKDAGDVDAAAEVPTSPNPAAPSYSAEPTDIRL